MGDRLSEACLVDEEFAVWKRNTPLLYDMVITCALEWPSLTVQFLPTPPLSHPDHSAVHKLILGTHTSDGFPNFIMLAEAFLPLNISEHNNPTHPGSPTAPKVDITHKIRVDGEVNRARCMWQNPDIVAVKTNGSDVYVFDSSKPSEGDIPCNPSLTLKGHKEEGYGLSWSSFREGCLLSGSNDHKICLWDVLATPQDKVLHPVQSFEDHESLVEDVSWHWKNENMFGSVDDDGILMLWDFRMSKPQHSVQVHDKEVNYLSFSSYNEWILATASSDTTVGLHDIRNLTTPLHFLSSHTEEVYQVEWDPNHETVLASSAGDRRLMVWDLKRIGDEQTEGDGEDGPLELLFSHGGHKGRISDFCWNRKEPWVITSVAEDNSLQIWKMAETICCCDEDL